MRRTLLLAAMLVVVGALSLFTLRQARSYFDLNSWYMYESPWCQTSAQLDPLNLVSTHYASADNVTWELDYHGYWPNTDAGAGTVDVLDILLMKPYLNTQCT